MFRYFYNDISNGKTLQFVRGISFEGTAWNTNFDSNWSLEINEKNPFNLRQSVAVRHQSYILGGSI